MGSRSESPPSMANLPAFRTGAVFAFGLFAGAGTSTELSLLTRGFLPTFFLTATGAGVSITGAALFPVAARALVVLVAVGMAVVVILALDDALVVVNLPDMD